jgi:Protein of unknown function (DUF2867)
LAKEAQIPFDCTLAEKADTASYCDCFATELAQSDERLPVALFFEMLHPAPVWVRSLMNVRNAVVGFFGLQGTNDRPLGPQKEYGDYGIGDHIDFFKIMHLGDQEVVVTANDRHLDSSFSLQIVSSDGEKQVFMTSIVETKEKLGDVYMFFIAPFHRLIVSRLMNRL